MQERRGYLGNKLHIFMTDEEAAHLHSKQVKNPSGQDFI